jgi:sigma-B regulation protein RsbU (phosphoserine phosphatase)
VATIAGGLRDLMRQNINLIQQTQFVREMNRQFSEQPSRTGFATALVCTFFAPTRSLQFCNAGHPAPMLYRAEEGKWSSVQNLVPVERVRGFADTPLGVVEGADYSRFDTKLSHGDMMLCVSDAFTECLDTEGNLLGTEGLMRVVEDLDPAEPAQIIPTLIDRLSRRREGSLSQDDATALLFRADGSSVSLTDNLAAPFRLLRPARDNTAFQT